MEETLIRIRTTTIPWRYKFERFAIFALSFANSPTLSLSVAVWCCLSHLKWLLLRLPPPSNAQSASMTSPTAVAVLSWSFAAIMSSISVSKYLICIEIDKHIDMSIENYDLSTIIIPSITIYSLQGIMVMIMSISLHSSNYYLDKICLYWLI